MLEMIDKSKDRGMGREMTPTTMPAKAGHFSPVILWFSLPLVCVEPSVLRPLPHAEGRLVTIARSRVAFSVDYYLFFLPIYVDSQAVCDWISAM